jgi:hypothetical protein
MSDEPDETSIQRAPRLKKVAPEPSSKREQAARTPAGGSEPWMKR